MVGCVLLILFVSTKNVIFSFIKTICIWYQNIHEIQFRKWINLIQIFKIEVLIAYFFIVLVGLVAQYQTL